MPISNLPTKTKYTPGDSVFIFTNSEILLPVTITSWRVEVTNPSGDGVTGVETKYYSFEEIGYERVENEVFASKGQFCFWLKCDDINKAIESGGGGNHFFQQLSPKADLGQISMGGWTDFAGWDMSYFNGNNNSESEVVYVIFPYLSECYFDATNLGTATLPPPIGLVSSNLALFKSSVKSYDKNLTLLGAGNPIGE